MKSQTSSRRTFRGKAASRSNSPASPLPKERIKAKPVRPKAAGSNALASALKSGTYKSGALAAIHETVSDLNGAGLADKKTMRRFDELCLTPVTKLSAREIKEIREEAQLSQSVFARYLNVTTGVVSKWERGDKSPAGPSLKLLSLVRAKGIDFIA